MGGMIRVSLGRVVLGRGEEMGREEKDSSRGPVGTGLGRRVRSVVGRLF